MGPDEIKILLVDDEQELRDVAGRAFEKHFTVLSAACGREALELLSANEVDCIILDIEMPGMSGIAMLKKLRASGDYTHVIITTGKSCRAHAEQAADLNVHGYIIKPYQPSVLAERIKSIITLAGNSPEKLQSVEQNFHASLNYAIDYLNENYEKPLDVYELSTEAAISYSHLADLFKNNFGVSITAYLSRLRVGKAKEFIRKGELSLSEIARAVGFNTEQHFFKQFKRFTGITPRSLVKK